MSKECCAPGQVDAKLRRVLWIALLINAAMFAVELGGGMHARSSALLADAADFLGDAANYGISLWVLPLGIAWRARAAQFKAVSMCVYGAAVLAWTASNAWRGALPEPETMGVVGTLALAANVGVALLLYRYRTGDSNMRAVWLCTRNDAIGNLLVLAAALGVFGTGSGWPDYAVAFCMAALALSAGVSVLRQAQGELTRDAHRH